MVAGWPYGELTGVSFFSVGSYDGGLRTAAVPRYSRTAADLGRATGEGVIGGPAAPNVRFARAEGGKLRGCQSVERGVGLLHVLQPRRGVELV